MIDYDKLQKSLKHLEQQFANYKLAQDRAELTDIDREAIAESVIHRFETCYDTLWKDLKRYLIEDSGLADVPDSPKKVQAGRPERAVRFTRGAMAEIRGCPHQHRT